jgi:hypothetical protein
MRKKKEKPNANSNVELTVLYVHKVHERTQPFTDKETRMHKDRCTKESVTFIALQLLFRFVSVFLLNNKLC